MVPHDVRTDLSENFLLNLDSLNPLILFFRSALHCMCIHAATISAKEHIIYIDHHLIIKQERWQDLAEELIIAST